MNLGELVNSLRVDSDDKAEAQLTKDNDAIRFFNEAVDEAAVRARLIFDTTQTIEVTAGTSRYDFTGLFEITRATLYRQLTAAVGPTPATYATTRGERLYDIERDDLDAACPDWREQRMQPGLMIVDDVSVTLPGIPDKNYIIRLEGYRLAKKPMADSGDKPEIHPQHHRFLVYWALHRAYEKPDSEIFNPQKSAKALTAFEDYFGYRPTANERKREQASRPHRVTSYW